MWLSPIKYFDSFTILLKGIGVYVNYKVMRNSIVPSLMEELI